MAFGRPSILRTLLKITATPTHIFRLINKSLFHILQVLFKLLLLCYISVVVFLILSCYGQGLIFLSSFGSPRAESAKFYPDLSSTDCKNS